MDGVTRSTDEFLDEFVHVLQVDLKPDLFSTSGGTRGIHRAGEFLLRTLTPDAIIQKISTS